MAKPKPDIDRPKNARNANGPGRHSRRKEGQQMRINLKATVWAVVLAAGFFLASTPAQAQQDCQTYGGCVCTDPPQLLSSEFYCTASFLKPDGVCVFVNR